MMQRWASRKHCHAGPAGLAALTLGWLGACSPAAPALPPRAAAPAKLVREPALAPSPPAQLWLQTRGELLVGSLNGLFAYSVRGNGHRLISAGAALHPRWYDAQSVLVVSPAAAPDSSALEPGAKFEQVALNEGARRVLGELPALQCRNAPSEPRTADGGTHLGLQDPGDFVVDAQRRVACLQLMDAGWNTASMRLEVRLDLAARSVQSWLTIGLEGCSLPSVVQRGSPPDDGFCPVEADQTPPVQPDVAGFDFSFSDACVRDRNGTASLRVPTYQVERRSFSGRWLLLAGDVTESDQLYRRFLLLDRSSGQLFAVPEEARPWPFPLTASAPVQPGAAPVLATPIESAAAWPAETDVRFVSDGLDGDLLIIERLVIRPGQDMFDIAEGSVAR